MKRGQREWRRYASYSAYEVSRNRRICANPILGSLNKRETTNDMIRKREDFVRMQEFFAILCGNSELDMCSVGKEIEPLISRATRQAAWGFWWALEKSRRDVFDPRVPGDRDLIRHKDYGEDYQPDHSYALFTRWKFDKSDPGRNPVLRGGQSDGGQLSYLRLSVVEVWLEHCARPLVKRLAISPGNSATASMPWEKEPLLRDDWSFTQKSPSEADPEGVRTMGVLTKPDLAIERATHPNTYS
jgi:hypothetical protein